MISSPAFTAQDRFARRTTVHDLRLTAARPHHRDVRPSSECCSRGTPAAMRSVDAFPVAQSGAAAGL
jgi:hypothetical protein